MDNVENGYEIISTKPTENASPDSMRNMYLTFFVGDEEYGVAIKNVIQIIVLQRVYKMPEMPLDMPGFINLRGDTIPLTSLRTRFGYDTGDYDERTCVVVVQVGEKLHGLIVDKIKETVTFLPEEISPPPCTDDSTMPSYITGVMGKDAKESLLLDVEKMFSVN